MDGVTDLKHIYFVIGFPSRVNSYFDMFLENIVREKSNAYAVFFARRNSAARRRFISTRTRTVSVRRSGNYHRYPDPLQAEIKVRIAEINQVNSSEISSATVAMRRLIYCSEFFASRARITF
jgi:hypothetical protein